MDRLVLAFCAFLACSQTALAEDSDLERIIAVQTAKIQSLEHELESFRQSVAASLAGIEKTQGTFNKELGATRNKVNSRKLQCKRVTANHAAGGKYCPSVPCPSGYTVQGGGGQQGWSGTMVDSFPHGNGWKACMKGSSEKLVVWAICCRI